RTLKDELHGKVENALSAGPLALAAAAFFGAVAILRLLHKFVENAPFHASLIVVGFAGRCKSFLSLFVENVTDLAV
ncbi:hypothetical protein, partial [uncultured Limnohabitans sp.]|uniref:hypothetical protein n=1 Tax=uncultured Limnohabitans sp. TaxID=768543 RepID=UPI00260D2F44